MALAELIGKLRNKKQTATKTAFSHYLEAVRKLASGTEIDADEVGHIIDAAGRDESALEKDVNLQQQRLTWHAQLVRNRKAAQDRVQAEIDLQAAQKKLQDALNALQPAVDAARTRVADANHSTMVTAGAEAWLAGNVLDTELLEREQALNTQLTEINAELRPLLEDRGHKQHSLGNAEFNLARLQSRKEGDWMPAGIVQYFNQTQDVKELTERVNDLRNQLSQLDEAIRPRQAEQHRLQAELNQIHQQKLLP